MGASARRIEKTAAEQVADLKTALGLAAARYGKHLGEAEALDVRATQAANRARSAKDAADALSVLQVQLGELAQRRDDLRAELSGVEAAIGAAGGERGEDLTAARRRLTTQIAGAEAGMQPLLEKAAFLAAAASGAEQHARAADQLRGELADAKAAAAAAKIEVGRLREALGPLEVAAREEAAAEVRRLDDESASLAKQIEGIAGPVVEATRALVALAFDRKAEAEKLIARRNEISFQRSHLSGEPAAWWHLGDCRGFSFLAGPGNSANRDSFAAEILAALAQDLRRR